VLTPEIQNKVIAEQARIIAQNSTKNPEFKIQNSAISKTMTCKEQLNGDIVCELADCDLETQDCEIGFDVQELGTLNVDHEYMRNQFDERYVFQFDDESDKQDDFGAFTPVIEMAVCDYDRMVFSLKQLKNGHSHEALTKFNSDLKLKNLVGLKTPLLEQEYDTFDIEQFWSFCKTCPITGDAQDGSYPFVNLTNVN